jgi:hypothetical protein
MKRLTAHYDVLNANARCLVFWLKFASESIMKSLALNEKRSLRRQESENPESNPSLDGFLIMLQRISGVETPETKSRPLCG